MTIEEQLAATLRVADRYQPSADLFEKVTRSIEDDVAHRRRVRRYVIAALATVGFALGYVLLALDRVDGIVTMSFWSLELLVTGIMILVVAVVGPAIRRFGTAFESEVFHSSAGTGASFLTLMDVAYYMVFGAYVFMSLRYMPPVDARGAGHLLEWVGWETQRVAGLLMLMGVLHLVTLVLLPVIGLVFSANTRRAQRAELGSGAPVVNQRNEHVDRWISIAVWVLTGLALVLLSLIVLPVLIGLGG